MNGDDVRAFRHTLREFERVLADSYDQTCSESGVTMAQCHLLIELDAARSTSLKELAERLDLDPSTVSRTVETLVGRGLVVRRQDPSDRRLQRLELTPDGIETAERLHRENDAYFGRILSDIPSDRRGEVLRAFELLVQASRGRGGTGE